MTRVPAAWRELHEMTADLAGAYLMNIDRSFGADTCLVCATPVDGWARCWQCKTAVENFGDELADRVGSVTYVVERSQAAVVMYGYKSKIPQEAHRQIVRLLFADALGRHTMCAGNLAGQPVDAWALVPSLHSGRSDHVLPQIVEPFLTDLERVPVKAVKRGKPRTVDPSQFAVDGKWKKRHVLVVDDTWTSGGEAQSVAVGLKRAGAYEVSILTLARWLHPQTWPTTREWLDAHPKRDFVPGICPYTAGDCP